MKLIFTLALLAISYLTFAAKTLDQYDASNKYLVKWPQVSFDKASVAVKNVCIDGETLKTINPIKICTKTAPVEVCTRARKENEESCRNVRRGETPKENSRIKVIYGCVSYASQILERSRSYEETVCTSWKKNPAAQGKESSEPKYICVESEVVSRELPDNYDVSVFTRPHADYDSLEVATINYALSQCK